MGDLAFGTRNHDAVPPSGRRRRGTYGPEVSDCHWYRLGTGAFGIDSDDEALTTRFEELYGECACEPPENPAAVRCTVRADAQSVQVTFADPEPLDVPGFVAAVFPERGYRALPQSAAPAHRLGLPDGAEIELSADGRSLRAPTDSDWRPLVANLLLSRSQRLQRDVIYFHAAALAVRGRGVLACGPRRAGKTTLALGLAARGHGLLADELVGVRLGSHELLPVRRAVSVRQGPGAAAARAALERAAPREERYPDGELRYRAAMTALFPAPDAVVRLTHILFLRGFTPTPLAEPAAATEVLGRLTPLAASLWGRSPGSVTVQLLRLLAAARCHWLDAGTPEATAELIEHLVEQT